MITCYAYHNESYPQNIMNNSFVRNNDTQKALQQKTIKISVT